MTWRDRAECRGMDPERFHAAGTVPAEIRAVCQRCPVRDDCLDYALSTRQAHGVWGGLTTNERAALARRLRDAGRDVPYPIKPGRPGPNPLAEVEFAPHGTEAALRRHHRRGEPACSACLAAAADAERRRARYRSEAS